MCCCLQQPTLSPHYIRALLPCHVPGTLSSTDRELLEVVCVTAYLASYKGQSPCGNLVLVPWQGHD
jgi:hypothetical protein